MTVTELLSNLRGELVFELSGERIPDEDNPSEDDFGVGPNAKIEGADLVPAIWDPELEDIRDLTSEEKETVVTVAQSIRLRSFSGEEREFEKDSGKPFTVNNLIAYIGAFEMFTRKDTEWFGGIDVHHVMLEGVVCGEDGVWEAIWGS